MKKLLFRIVGVLGALGAPLLIGSVAHAADFTWNGGGTPDGSGNLLFSDVANWTGGVPATDGTATLVFPKLEVGTNLMNDLTANTVFSGINFTVDGTATGAGCPIGGYTIKGNAIHLAGNISVLVSPAGTACYVSGTIDLPIVADQALALNGSASNGAITLGTSANSATSTFNLGSYNLTTDGNITLVGNITGSGNINIASGDVSLYGSNTGFTGNINVASGSNATAKTPSALGATAVNVTVTSGGYLTLCGNDSGHTYSQDITLGGEGITSAYDNSKSGALLLTKICGLGGGGSYVPANTELTGTITLTANTTVASGDNLKISGPLGGAHTITAIVGSTGTLTVSSSANTSQTPNGTQAVVITSTTYSDALPAQFLNVGQTDLAIVTGTRGDTNVSGTLKGTGTVGTLTVNPGGKLAPGLSPGCINSGNLVLAGTYEVELADLTACTEYDQTIVTGTVDVTGATLSVIRYDNMIPRLNNSFTIIKNDGADAVVGTFSGLAQGATVVSGGITYSISYTGGDGNDVVLVVTAVDSSLGAPNTGAYVIKSGIILPILAITASMAIIGMNFVSTKKAVVKKK